METRLRPTTALLLMAGDPELLEAMAIANTQRVTNHNILTVADKE
jgi:hypothetical protein